jgi:hypothetical protein
MMSPRNTDFSVISGGARHDKPTPDSPLFQPNYDGLAFLASLKCREAGAVAILRHARNRATKDAEWVRALLARRPAKMVAVALANRTTPHCLGGDGAWRSLPSQSRGLGRPGKFNASLERAFLTRTLSANSIRFFEGSRILGWLHSPMRTEMTQPERLAPRSTAPDYDYHNHMRFGDEREEMAAWPFSFQASSATHGMFREQAARNWPH